MRKLRPHFLIYFGNFAVFPHDSTQSAESRRCTPPQDLLVLGCRPQQENGSGVTGAKARLRTSQLEAADLALTATCHEKSHFSFDQWNVITWFRVDHYVKQTSIKLKRREIVNSSLKFWLSERIEWKCFNRRKMRVSGTRGRIWKINFAGDFFVFYRHPKWTHFHPAAASPFSTLRKASNGRQVSTFSRVKIGIW